jgi:hypothetical protein
MLRAIDLNDPCARAGQLRAIRTDLLGGTIAVDVAIRGRTDPFRLDGVGPAWTRYAAGDMDRLDREIVYADAACRIAGGSDE